jgi:shikimate dehydrogenase
MPVNYKSELVGVFGFPVAENPTGVMQEAAFAALGLNWRYLTIEVKPKDLPDAIRGLRAFGMRGVNLTIPHKVAVMELLDEISSDAALIGAVNTVYAENDRLIGANTDGKGFLRGLAQDAGIDPKGKQVVVLGAGGAARAIATELCLAGAASLTIVNRSEERGARLVSDLEARLSADARFVLWDRAYHVNDEADILVNATSIGLYPDVEAVPEVDLTAARPDLLVCDVIPNPPQTPFLRLAQTRGLKTLDGLAMLVYQGAIAFELWTGQKAPEEAMKNALHEAFGA